MKKIYFAALAALAMLSAACTTQLSDDANLQKQKGTVYINVCNDSFSTKASSTTSTDYEKAVKDVQILVFDDSDLLVAYHATGTQTSNITLNVAEGVKDVWAIVNGPDLKGISKKADLLKYSVGLADNDLNPNGKGFIMSGHSTVTVSALTPTSANIVVERLVSRVRLARVSNNLPAAYPALTVESVCLANTVGNQNLSGTEVEKTWYNKMGTSNGTQTKIIDGVTNLAQLPDYTFYGEDKALNNGESFAPGCYFYSYPNSTSVDVDGWSDPFTARMSRLVLGVRIDGNLYYYPIVLDSTLERNKTYDVEVSIISLGSKNPWEKIEKGDILTNITVKEWVPGDSYSESI